MSKNRYSRRFVYPVVLLAVAGLLLFLVGNIGWRPIENAIESTVEERDSAGYRYDAIGDSITLGENLGFSVDQDGHPKRTTTRFQGWPALLGQMLAERTGARTEIFNEGYPGDRVGKSLANRLPTVFSDESNASRALLLIGTNDSNDFQPTPSGLGCGDLSCDGTYKAYMWSVIRNLRVVGRDIIYVALLTPAWGSKLHEPYADPLDFPSASRNARIVEYNQVIIEDLLALPGVRPGPDFFSCFLTPTRNRFSLFKNTLHPNKLGYVFMAALWRDAITGEMPTQPADSCPSPVYVLESLDPYAHGHKQNLLEEGDTYYTDEPFTLLNIPNELKEGIWVSQANADKGNSDASFLRFDVGEAPVTAYVAYDPAGSPPTSLSHAFEPVTLSSNLTTSDPLMRVFGLVSAQGITGTVIIGGTLSAAGSAAQQGYIVVIVP